MPKKLRIMNWLYLPCHRKMFLNKRKTELKVEYTYTSFEYVYGSSLWPNDRFLDSFYSVSKNCNIRPATHFLLFINPFKLEKKENEILDENFDGQAADSWNEFDSFDLMRRKGRGNLIYLYRKEGETLGFIRIIRKIWTVHHRIMGHFASIGLQTFIYTNRTAIMPCSSYNFNLPNKSSF